MGTFFSDQHTQSSRIPKIIDDWKKVEHFPDFDIVKRRDKQVYGEMRKFKLDPIYQPKKQLAIYRKRNSLDDPIVGILAAEQIQKISKFSKDSKDNTCLCGNNNFFTVITERIPKRLESMCQLTFPQNLYILLQSLKGYKLLFPKVGPIHVTNRMIGLNQDGRCKVWINQDWSQNHPSTSINFLLSSWNPRDEKQYNVISPELREEREMVENIVDVIEEKCQVGKFPADFGNKVKGSIHSFSRAIQFIEEYIDTNRIYMPDRIMENVVKTSRQEMLRIQDRYLIYQNQQTYQQQMQNRVIQDRYRFSQTKNKAPIQNFSYAQIQAHNQPPKNAYSDNFMQYRVPIPTYHHSNAHSRPVVHFI